MKILITDKRHASIEEEKKVLEPLGFEIDTTICHCEEDLILNGKGAFGFLVSYSVITRRVMEALPELKIIVKYGAGYDNIDVAAAKELGKIVCNVPDHCTEEVAFQSLTLTVAALRHLYFFIHNTKKGNWIEDPTIKKLLRPSTLVLGVIGFGRIAKQYVRFMEPMVKEVMFFDPYVPVVSQEFAYCKKVETIIEIGKNCDIIALFVPLTKDTQEMINSEFLHNVHNAILINTSRGGLIDYVALLDALENGTLKFFASDVYSPEPPLMSDDITERLFARDDVIVSPHVGWYSIESEKELRRKAAEEIASFWKTKIVKHQVS
jgi:D-3-phosphoglycerate dehydrogenase